jgi:23S rRNA pseudouridine2605 synthase
VSGNDAGRQIGLARAISKLGYCSRSQAAALIRGGRVQLNTLVRRDPETPVHLTEDRIVVDGRVIEPARKIYLMMNKPRGLVTTVSDEKGRATVYSLLEKSQRQVPWVAPIGRLDKASEGLLLLTNDSGWGARIAAPETHLEKTYHVQVASLDGEQLAAKLAVGIKVDADFLRAREACLLRLGEKNCWLEIILDEGKNRQIRRMLAEFEIEVLRLIRVAIGPLVLGNLAKGSFRLLATKEKLALDRAIRHQFRTHD